VLHAGAFIHPFDGNVLHPGAFIHPFDGNVLHVGAFIHPFDGNVLHPGAFIHPFDGNVLHPGAFIHPWPCFTHFVEARNDGGLLFCNSLKVYEMSLEQYSWRTAVSNWKMLRLKMLILIAVGVL
jgi:hypothetical protein